MAYTTIDNPVEYFNTKLYTGTGSSQSITGVGFQPDWVWLKDRTSAYNHAVFDKVRGVQKRIFTNLTNAEDTASDTLTAFDSDGFTIGNNVGINTNTNNYVSWNWKANGAGVSNTAGTITSTVSANTTSGFSIVSYTGNGTSGATVGHGIGSTIGMMLVKGRSFSDNWAVYHKSIGGTGLLELNGTGGTNTVSTRWNDTNAGATVFTLGNNSQVNGSGSTYIAYCFAEVKGFSKAFSYTGNGSSDGTYVHLGFRPAFIMYKNSNFAGTSWAILDNKRNTYNVANLRLFADSSSAEDGTNMLDILSNGFKARSTNDGVNRSGDKIIGIAFASNPFVSSKGIPACAV